jgi:outer membrane protein assembly factor BamB
MHNRLLLLLVMILFKNCYTQPVHTSAMFRGDAAHDSYVATTDQLIYDTKAWQYDAGSPVRSTPLLNNGIVYFGNAGGTFFAVYKKSGQLKWKYTTGKAIHSSAACQDGRIFFSDNGQTIYCLKESNGQLLWKTKMGEKQAYPWRYDYFYSSPVLYEGKVFIGGDDGYFYSLDQQSGKIVWKFKCKGIIRSTGAIYRNSVVFGDTEASLYSVDLKTGKERWQFKIVGDSMNNDNYGYDRRAITSSAVVVGNKIIVGARDGYLYCINGDNGKQIWQLNYVITWVISTAAVKDSLVVTGTSDGRYVNAVNIETGKETWRFRTPSAVWSSPLIVNDKVYVGTFDGHLFCVDLKTGKRLSEFKTNGKILSSPVWSDGLLYVGSDDGHLYALTGHEDKRQYKEGFTKYVFYENGINAYFKNNSDLVIKNYLRMYGYKLIGSDSLAFYMSKEPANSSVFVFASCYFPASVTGNGKSSILRKFLDDGGKIIMAGINPIVYQFDESMKTPVGFRFNAADTLLGLDYGKGDTRSFMGDLPCFPTTAGKQLGLPDSWTTSLFINEKNVDVVLGKNENGDVSAFVKKYNNGGQFVQLWMDADRPDRLDAIIKAAEWQL